MARRTFDVIDICEIFTTGMRAGRRARSRAVWGCRGQLGRWMDPWSGRRHVVWAFAMVLCCSRFLFVRPVIRMDQRAWTECHVAAMEFFGGVPARLVPEYVPRNIFHVLCPVGLCDRQ